MMHDPLFLGHLLKRMSYFSSFSIFKCCYVQYTYVHTLARSLITAKELVLIVHSFCFHLIAASIQRNGRYSTNEAPCIGQQQPVYAHER